MNESDGVHGPVNEEVIASLFEKHHGPKVYQVRTGRIPEWYTTGFQYFYEIYNGKILSTLGYIDNGNYYILGGAFVYTKWKQESGYFGQPFMKLMNAREGDLKTNLPKIAGFKYTGPVTPDRNQETYIEMMGKFYNIEPMDTKGIPEEMVDNFRQRYPGAWGIRKDAYNSENMAKALWDWNSSTWWDVIKNTKQISGTGIKTKLGTKPLTISDDNEDDCCEEALEKFVDLYPDVMSIRKWTCERLRRFLGQKLDWEEVAEDYLIFINKERQILKEWEECENE